MTSDAVFGDDTDTDPRAERPPGGLSRDEVAARIAAGAVNAVPTGSGRTFAQILRANLFTRFNAILGTLFVVVLVVGPLQDALFGVVLALNALMGIVQELRAKHALDRLAVLTAPVAHAVREGGHHDIAAGEVVVDDLLELWPGDQIPADGTLLDAGGLEVDESLVSGESMPVEKHPQDTLFSGSAVLAGRGMMRVDRVGADAFGQRLELEARRFDLVRSELRQGINRILRVIGWLMVPLGALLVTGQVLRSGQGLGDAVRGSVAGTGAMVPEGLVLLTTIAFAVGAVRLARQRVLVQELAAIEGLARVDLLCIDKTGTLTEPGLRLADVVPVGNAPALDALGSMAATDPAPNATMLAARAVPGPGWRTVSSVPFSSLRKWSAREFAGHGTWVLGAPDIVMPALAPQLAREVHAVAAGGRRVLLVARTDSHLTSDALPGGLECAGWAVFEERIRPDARETVDYLRAQGIRVLILSGDDPRTVATVARDVGIPGSDRTLHAATLPADPDELGSTMLDVSVVGRVQPYQKRDIVRALQAQGHVVAMTGDGVNDVPALKAADLGIAMGTGSPAARAVGRAVLLDSVFAAVPRVLAEGRRVIANIERVAQLFLAKTVYATVLAVAVGASGVPYPFFPRHLTLVSSLTIGIPGFFLALAPGAPRAQPGFVTRVLRVAGPASVAAGAGAMAAFPVVREALGTPALASRTAATGVLVGVGLALLAVVARPLTGARALVVAAMAGAAVLAWVVPLGRQLFGLEAPSATATWASLAIGAAVLLAMVAGVRVWRAQPPSSADRATKE
ncbi:MAG TPA: HAD-IC family P-type ATPase [Acidimicrobiales bacterium]|nr:HAD-IC family P-type ATPase [Acidimicrobiales bacterium]